MRNIRNSNITIRDTTEHPDTLETGFNILSGSVPESFLRCIEYDLSHPVSGNATEKNFIPKMSSTIGKIFQDY
jgi:UDP-N-acetylglucosamine 2-epimerase (non-hydrolysing)